ncbi:hypothetical protein [Tolumonas lignilytica]|jgi:hypothetical protein|uniref:hypothetical protein n=1 Tax=Tolumonas lignilytica TaxID=1283284 RepID=UPI0004B38C76|nr:hypothetical protein [Tolumonas lignilytica]
MQQDIDLTVCGLPQQIVGNALPILLNSYQKPLQMGLFSVPLHPALCLTIRSYPV